MEYVSREDARRVVCDLCRWAGTSNCEECEHPIDDIPKANVRAIKARWEWDLIDGTPGYRPVVMCCSNCHRVSMVEWAFCPICGAEMSGGQI